MVPANPSSNPRSPILFTSEGWGCAKCHKKISECICPERQGTRCNHPWPCSKEDDSDYDDEPVAASPSLLPVPPNPLDKKWRDEHFDATLAYFSAKDSAGLPVGRQLEPKHSAPEVLDYATGVQGSYVIRRIFEWGPSRLPTAEFWNPSGWSASGYVINDRKLADAICNLLASLPVGESMRPKESSSGPDKG